MSAEIITAAAALLAALGGIIGSILLNRKTQALLEYRMQQVEDRLDKHNHYAEKLTDMAISLAEIRKDIQYIKEKDETKD